MHQGRWPAAVSLSLGHEEKPLKTTALFSWVSIRDSDVFIGFQPLLTSVDRMQNLGYEDQVFFSILFLDVPSDMTKFSPIFASLYES